MKNKESLKLEDKWTLEKWENALKEFDVFVMIG